MNPETWERIREYYLDPAGVVGHIRINPGVLAPWLVMIVFFYSIARKHPPRRVLLSFLILPLFIAVVMIEPEMIVWQFLIIPAWIIYVAVEMSKLDRQKRHYQERIARQWPKRQRRILAFKKAATSREPRHI